MSLEDEIEQALTEDLLLQFVYPSQVNAMVNRLCRSYHRSRSEMDAMVRSCFKKAVGDGMLADVYVKNDENITPESSNETLAANPTTGDNSTGNYCTNEIASASLASQIAGAASNDHIASASFSPSVNRRRRSSTPAPPLRRGPISDFIPHNLPDLPPQE